MKKIFALLLTACNIFSLSAQWTTSGSDIYNSNAGNVAIGTTTTTAKLTLNGVYHLNRPTNIGDQSSMLGIVPGSYLGMAPTNISASNNSYMLFHFPNDNTFRISTNYSGYLANGYFRDIEFGRVTETNPYLIIKDGGKVGIGTASPGSTLTVAGNIYASNTLIVDAQTPGSATAWFRGPASSNSNVIIQGSEGNYQAFWLTAANGVFKIGANGGTEPALGVINITMDDKVGIGTLNPGSFKLAVEGKIGAREIKVTLANPWPDYVFHEPYQFMSLLNLEKYINQHKHLPGIPTATEVKENGGIDLGDMNARLLEKIEELTLHMIEMKKEIKSLQKENQQLKTQVAALKRQ